MEHFAGVAHALSPWGGLGLFGVGVLAGFVNILAGGGSLVTVPSMIFLGLGETVANGTSRVAILSQNISALVRFQRAGLVDWPLVRRLIGPTLLGTVVGAVLAAQLPDWGFRRIFAAVMLGAALLVVVPPDRLFSRRENWQPRSSRRLVWPLFFLVGLYGGMIQAAIGYLLLAVLTLGIRLPLVQANIMKVVLVALYTPVAVAVFAATGNLAWLWGLLLAAGQSVGAWIGAGAVIRRGANLIRMVLLVMVIAGALELLGVFG